MKVENVAIVFFPINDVGGIITWNREIQKGLNKIGINTMYFYATAQNVLNCDPDKDLEKQRYTMIKGYHLSYNDKYIEDTIDILNKFDAVIFSKGSPHPTKDNLAKKDIENWKRLYTDVHVPKVMVFHDRFWYKTNAWLQDVANHVDILWCAQKKFMNSINESEHRYPGDQVRVWGYFPIDFKGISGNVPKKEIGLMASQWTKIKNHRKLLPLLPAIKIPFNFFGNGIEYLYLRKEDAFKNAIKNDFFDEKTYNKNSIHNFYGHTGYEELKNQYLKSFISLDLSDSGVTNYTHFEPMLFNCISVMRTEVANDPDNVIPEDCRYVVNMKNLVEDLNELKGKLRDKRILKIVENGNKFIQNLRCETVAEKLIKTINKL